jgi:hypothetical protein
VVQIAQSSQPPPGPIPATYQISVQPRQQRYAPPSGFATPRFGSYQPVQTSIPEEREVLYMN